VLYITGVQPLETLHAANQQSAAALDASDPLAPFLQRFAPIPDGLVYLDGNSLGRLPSQTRHDLQRVLQHEWGERLIRGWDEGWMELPAQVGDRLGRHLLGARPGTTLVADSTSVCFYKLAAAALAARPGRRTIVTDTDNFPTDRYIVEGLAQRTGRTINWIGSDPRSGPQPEQVGTALQTGDVALVTFSHVSYRSSHIADMRAITRLAHDAGALVLWDLSHTAGSVPVALDADDVDLAVGCTYKYLNGGPGAPAFLYVNHRLVDELRQPIQGWLGRADPFTMGPGYEPAKGIAKFTSGTPPVLALTATQTGIELCIEAGIAAIRAKSTQLTGYAIELADELLAPHGVTVGSPRDPSRRGGHVALVHERARDLTAELAQRDVIVDFRAPDVIRIGLSPLTTRFADVHAGLATLKELLD
jgi:kynureninase